jgi:predicted ABC-type ATPase
MSLTFSIESLRSALSDAIKRPGGAPIGSTSTHKDGSTYKKTTKGWKYVGQGKPKAGDDKPKSEPQKGFKFGGWKGFKKPAPGQPPKAGDLAPLDPKIPWKAKVHEPRSSAEKHTKGGSYTPERKKLHSEIFKAFMQHVPPVPKDKTPVAMMLMGGPATGKGSLTKTAPDASFVKIDADRIKEMLPEYQELVAAGDKNAASYVHKESGMLASRMRDYAKKNRQNMVLDGTGRFASSYRSRMAELQNADYHVQLMMPYVDDVEKVVQRSAQRGAETGRHVPEKFIRDNHLQISDNFLDLAKNANSAFLFDNSGKSPRMVYTSWEGGESEVDSDFMDSFRREHDRRGRQNNSLERTLSSLSELIGDDDSLSVDPRKLAKSAEQQKPEPEKEKRFSPDQGIILPEPDDAAI